MRGVTFLTVDDFKGFIFQPALPMRGVTLSKTAHLPEQQFQPALPMRGVTNMSGGAYGSRRFQPALPMRGVTKRQALGVLPFRISTRTPHAGSDRNIMRKIYCLDQHIAPIDKQGTRNKRVRHLYVTLFGANLTYVICELRARTMVLQCQEPFSFVRWLRTYMLNLRLIFASKTVESQTIFLRIDQLDELALDTNHRRSIGNAFEH